MAHAYGWLLDFGMKLDSLSNSALESIIARLGKEMTAGSSTVTIAKERERMIYIRELMKRGLCGYPSKKKYRLS